MARTTCKNYSKEFKIEAAKLVCEQGFSCVAAALSSMSPVGISVAG